MLHSHIVEGGIGKSVAFTAMVKGLAKKAGQPIQMFSGYPEVFGGNPDVSLSLPAGQIMDPRIMSSDDIFFVEPYKTTFQKGEMHLLESYCALYGLEYDRTMRPVLYTDYQRKHVNQWLSDRNISPKKLILVQFTGSQSPIGLNPQGQYIGSNMDKNYPYYLAQGMINYLKRKYPDYTILDCSLPNEPYYTDTIKCDLSWQVLPELLKKAKGFIAIDSCLMHMAAATKTPGVCLWGNTKWTQFGYTCHYNMTAMTENNFNSYEPVDVHDPRNIMVDPSAAVEVFDKHIIQGIDCLPFDNILPVK